MGGRVDLCVKYREVKVSPGDSLGVGNANCRKYGTGVGNMRYWTHMRCQINREIFLPVTFLIMVQFSISLHSWNSLSLLYTARVQVQRHECKCEYNYKCKFNRVKNLCPFIPTLMLLWTLMLTSLHLTVLGKCKVLNKQSSSMSIRCQINVSIRHKSTRVWVDAKNDIFGASTSECKSVCKGKNTYKDASMNRSENLSPAPCISPTPCIVFMKHPYTIAHALVFTCTWRAQGHEKVWEKEIILPVTYLKNNSWWKNHTILKQA